MINQFFVFLIGFLLYASVSLVFNKTLKNFNKSSDSNKFVLDECLYKEHLIGTSVASIIISLFFIVLNFNMASLKYNFLCGASLLFIISYNILVLLITTGVVKDVSTLPNDLINGMSITTIILISYVILITVYRLGKSNTVVHPSSGSQKLKSGSPKLKSGSPKRLR